MALVADFFGVTDIVTRLGPNCTSLIPSHENVCMVKHLYFILSFSMNDPFCYCFDRNKILLLQLPQSQWLLGRRKYNSCFIGWNLYISSRLRYDVFVCFPHLFNTRFTWAIFGVTSISSLPCFHLRMTGRSATGWSTSWLHMSFPSLLLKFISTFPLLPSYCLTESSLWAFSIHSFQWKDISISLEMLFTCLMSEMSFIVLDPDHAFFCQ